MGILEGKIALVTGGSSGIGRAAALAFAREGASVIIADIQVEGGEETLRMLKEAGGEGIFVKTDVSQPDEVRTLIQKAVETYSRLDCTFNNAGIEGEQAPTAECTEENWARVIGVNLTGVWLCMKYELLQMLKQGGGAIVNTSSVAGLFGFQYIAAYDASKHGVIGLTQTAALEYAKSGIRINAVCPGVIHTAMVERFTAGDSEAEAQLAEMAPMGRMGEPEEVAAAVVWLCSDAASFVTGQAICIDGGFVAQ